VNVRTPAKKGLTEAALNALLFHLDPDKEVAGKKYKAILYKLVKYFEWHRSPHPDEDADETMDRVARRLLEGETITDLLAYARGVAYNVYLETIKKEVRVQKALAEMARVQAVEEVDSDVDERLMQCFYGCLKKLPKSDRRMIIMYYGLGQQGRIETRAKLAEEIGIQMNALRIRAHRIKHKLEDCIRECCQKG
jgi:DNA-directed RNA polymerase specialized sigma24 family protein